MILQCVVSSEAVCIVKTAYALRRQRSLRNADQEILLLFNLKRHACSYYVAYVLALDKLLRIKLGLTSQVVNEV